MPPANLALWLNTQTLGFGQGPTDASPYLAPLIAVQNGTYIVDVYFVQPTFNPSAPWTYQDPATFAGAGLTLGNRTTFASYVNVTSYTATSDSYGPKARFILAINSSQLNSDLATAACVVAIFQVNWVTTSATPVAQLSAQINKELGNTAGPVPTYSGTVALTAGATSYTLTGAALPIAPLDYAVKILKASPNDDNITVTLRQGFSADGFTVDFQYLPNANYILSWQAIYAA